MDATLESLRDFHSHLGPYLVVGYRMGCLATKLLNAHARQLHATVHTGTNTPLSCLIDGIQCATGCTLGKGNITVTDEGVPSATFTRKSDGRQITIKLKDAMKKRADAVTHENEEEESLWFYDVGEEELFEVFI
jgi:formylmethanofuran dehydrogenase subunit E